MDDGPMAMGSRQDVDRMTMVGGQDADRVMQGAVAAHDDGTDGAPHDDVMMRCVAVMGGRLLVRGVARLRGGRGRNGERDPNRSHDHPKA